MDTIFNRASVGQLVWLFICGLLVATIFSINAAYYGTGSQRELSAAETADILKRGSASGDTPSLSNTEKRNLIKASSPDENVSPLSENEKQELLKKANI